MSLANAPCRPLFACTFLAYLLGTTGCRAWHTQQGDFAAVITPPPRESPGSRHGDVAGLTAVHPAVTERPDTVRFIRATLPARGTVELWNPRVADDSLFGQLVKGGPEAGFRVADVTSIQTKGTSMAKTAALVFGVAALAFVVANVAVSASLCSGTTEC